MMEKKTGPRGKPETVCWLVSDESEKWYLAIAVVVGAYEQARTRRRDHRCFSGSPARHRHGLQAPDEVECHPAAVYSRRGSRPRPTYRVQSFPGSIMT